MQVSSIMLVRQNLTRKRARSLLLVLSIGIAFFVYGVLSSFQAGFEGSEAKAERLVVVSKIGGNETLPISALDQIAQLPEVAAVTHITRLRAHLIGNERQIIGANAVDPDSYAAVYGDTYKLDPALLAALAADRTGTLVGRTLAEQQGWQVGDRVTLTSFVHANSDGRNWSFTIAGIFDGREPTVDTNFLIVRSDYFNTALQRGRNRVNMFGIKPVPGADPAVLAETIDTAFANSAAQTKTQNETAFLSAFLEQFANVSLIVRMIVSVAFVTILLIVGNTMIFAVRERMQEIGVLKVLGFSGARIMRIVLAETIVLFAVGLALGLLLTSAVIPLLGQALRSVVPELYLTTKSISLAGLLALGFALLTGFLPALNALRLPIVAALRHR
ncbi:FtsX-like permease family protein [Phaeobacter sp. HF9A]|uniref:ABC transporter permease n=1 Tax=Phaeobacter sp. HF9A TaxID=2721561 RepID=UPI001430FCF2|nr:FtsX-like permease family protein [Phaeobacter sp. HF9A]NIZ13559.1 FtsX-like permease family protein [Phaeobacter sp. HF9A]